MTHFNALSPSTQCSVELTKNSGNTSFDETSIDSGPSDFSPSPEQSRYGSYDTTPSSSAHRHRRMHMPHLGNNTRVNLGRIAALPINMMVYFAVGTYSKSVGNAKKAKESRYPRAVVPVAFVAGAMTGGTQAAGNAVHDTVQIIRGKRSRRQTPMMLV